MRWFLLHFVTRRALVRRINELLTHGASVFTPCFSGRTAIFQAARLSRDASTRRIAYVPDYICNVVERALTCADYEVRTYETDSNFEPRRLELEAIVDNPETGVVVLANVYGSSAGSELLGDAEFRRRVVNSQVLLLWDICQDVSFARRLPAGYGSQLVGVVSFNDKSFPGAMGGGLLTSQPVRLEERRISWRQTLRLYYFLLRKTLRAKLRSLQQALGGGRQQPAVGYEYSRCEQFPFSIEPWGAVKLQLVMAVLGLKNFKRIIQKRQSRLASLAAVRELPFVRSAPFLTLNTRAEVPRLKVKRPYAEFDSPQSSLRADLLVIHNKGFDDV